MGAYIHPAFQIGALSLGLIARRGSRAGCPFFLTLRWCCYGTRLLLIRPVGAEKTHASIRSGGAERPGDRSRFAVSSPLPKNWPPHLPVKLLPPTTAMKLVSPVKNPLFDPISALPRVNGLPVTVRPSTSKLWYNPLIVPNSLPRRSWPLA